MRSRPEAQAIARHTDGAPRSGSEGGSYLRQERGASVRGLDDRGPLLDFGGDERLERVRATPLRQDGADLLIVVETSGRAGERSGVATAKS
jgi:hypothetical protein